jgi:hypothetical protein
MEELTKLRKCVEFIGSSKRLEENLKFVYKGVLKLLKTEFNFNYNLRVCKESNLKFFEYYFGVYALETNKQLEFYFDPLNNGKY